MKNIFIPIVLFSFVKIVNTQSLLPFTRDNLRLTNPAYYNSEKVLLNISNTVSGLNNNFATNTNFTYFQYGFRRFALSARSLSTYSNHYQNRDFGINAAYHYKATRNLSLFSGVGVNSVLTNYSFIPSKTVTMPSINAGVIAFSKIGNVPIQLGISMNSINEPKFIREGEKVGFQYIQLNIYGGAEFSIERKSDSLKYSPRRFYIQPSFYFQTLEYNQLNVSLIVKHEYIYGGLGITSGEYLAYLGYQFENNWKVSSSIGMMRSKLNFNFFNSNLSANLRVMYQLNRRGCRYRSRMFWNEL
jgi:hypothetical protein